LAVAGRQSAVSSQQSAVSGQRSEINSTVPSVFEIAGKGPNDRIIFLNNGVKFILSRAGDDIYSIAAEFGIYTWQLYRYNELERDEDIEQGQKIYLEKKKARGERDTYIVNPGDDLRSVSQDFGIRLKTLCRMSKKIKNDPLKEGEVLRLR
jgi:hypothetical protein